MATLAPALPLPRPVPVADPLARLRVELCYFWRHGRRVDLAGAPRFTDMVQRRKLFDRDPRQVMLMDKLAAKELAFDRLGPDWIIPTRWTGASLPPEMPFAAPAIVKARHGCNQNAVLRDTPTHREWQALSGKSARWTSQPYGAWLDEWAYEDVERGLLAEPLIGDGRTLPVDYKIYVFGGRATHVQVHLDRAGTHRWVLHDRNYRPLVAGSELPPPPRSLDAMLEAAEVLATGYDFLRVDFYEGGGHPLFGEFCLYPGSGLDPFAADWIDLELGALWHAAEAGSLAP